MNARLTLVAIAATLAGGSTDAHRLDEYLQATLISIEVDRVEALMRLTPGVAVAPVVVAAIDTDADGSMTTAEQRAYAERVLRDLTVTIDGEFLPLTLQDFAFPIDVSMGEGMGDIQIRFSAKLTRGNSRRTLSIKNYHHPNIGVYLVNCLVPSNRDIRIVAQHRNELQSVYEVEYEQRRDTVRKAAQR